jgi:hypothetical protein
LMQYRALTLSSSSIRSSWKNKTLTLRRIATYKEKKFLYTNSKEETLSCLRKTL